MSLTCLGLRGATTVDTNTKEAVVEATEELLREMASANDLAEEHVAAIFFTTTKDVNAEFPAVAARVRLGWNDTALLSAHEVEVPDAIPSVIRVLLMMNTEKSKGELVHVYLRNARQLRARGIRS